MPEAPDEGMVASASDPEIADLKGKLWRGAYIAPAQS
jgi:hypothetical protein